MSDKLTDKKYSRTYNPCDDCSYSFSENNQESSVCKICEFEQSLDLINRLQAELDEYKKIKTTINEFWEILLTLSLFKRKEKPTLEEFAEAIQEIKAEAYKECIEKATNKILPMLTTATLEKKETICFCLNKLDNLLKELVGEDK